MFVIYSARKEGVLWFTCTQWPHPFACGDLNSLRRCTTLLILVHGDHNYPFEGISMKSITLQSLVSMVDLRMESQRLMWWSLPFEEIAHVGQIDVGMWSFEDGTPLCYRVWYIVTLGDLTWNPFPSWGYFHHSMAVVSVWIADVPVLPYKHHQECRKYAAPASSALYLCWGDVWMVM